MLEIGARLLAEPKLSENFLGLPKTCTQCSQTRVRTGKVPRIILLERFTVCCVGQSISVTTSGIPEP